MTNGSTPPRMPSHTSHSRHYAVSQKYLFSSRCTSPVWRRLQSCSLYSCRSSIRVLVMASREEGFERTVIEGFSAGVPAVAFPTGDVAESIEDRQRGRIPCSCAHSSTTAASSPLSSPGHRSGDRVAGQGRKSRVRVGNFARRRQAYGPSPAVSKSIFAIMPLSSWLSRWQ